MRRIRAAVSGLAVAVAAHTAAGQDATLGRITPAASLGDIRPAGLLVRGQATNPMPPTAPPASGITNGGTGTPKPIGNGPAVDVIRDAAGGPAVPAMPAAPPLLGGHAYPVGTPIYDAPVAVPAVLPMDAAPVMDDPLFGAGPASPFAVGPAGGYGQGRLQLRADYLMWFVKANNLPPLLTTSSPRNNGQLGVGDTQTIFGGDSFGDRLHHGGRFGGTYWLGGVGQGWGLDGNVFFLGRNGNEFVADSNTYPVLARPFTSANTGLPFSELVASPGLAVGVATVNTETYAFGADVALRHGIYCHPCGLRVDLLGGFRYFNLNEELTVTERFARAPGAGAALIRSGVVTDSFRTENRFYGGQFGLAGEYRRGRWAVDARGSLAIGQVFQQVQIDGGQQLVRGDGSAAVASGGLLALPGANLGTFTQNKTAVMPEVGLNLGYYVTPRLKLSVGYSFLYLSSVLRPGDQIDPVLDVNRIPNFPVTPAQPAAVFVRPRPTLRDTDVFLQGINFGLTWTF